VRIGMAVLALTVVAPGAATAEPAAAFTADGRAFAFDTGVLKGTLRADGRSIGLVPAALGEAAVAKRKGYGLLSPYRLLSADARYGKAAWDWASDARRLPDGAVEVRWTADDAHPFGLTAVYRWAAADALDLAIAVAPRRDLKAFEVFLASYFEGCPESLVYAKGGPGGGPGFVPVRKAAGVWQVFPRDAAAVATVSDGRWKRPPHPVAWTVMPPYAGALAMRRDPATGIVALLMAPPDDCFGVFSPHGGEGHRSVYLSLIGRDVKAGAAASARARLVIGRGITEAGAVERYEAYLAASRGGK
jgi:hypothetical protein